MQERERLCALLFEATDLNTFETLVGRAFYEKPREMPAGCTDALASNYDVAAKVDDSSCDYSLPTPVDVSPVHNGGSGGMSSNNAGGKPTGAPSTGPLRVSLSETQGGEASSIPYIVGATVGAVALCALCAGAYARYRYTQGAKFTLPTIVRGLRT